MQVLHADRRWSSDTPQCGAWWERTHMLPFKWTPQPAVVQLCDSRYALIYILWYVCCIDESEWSSHHMLQRNVIGYNWDRTLWTSLAQVVSQMWVNSVPLWAGANEQTGWKHWTYHCLDSHWQVILEVVYQSQIACASGWMNAAFQYTLMVCIKL